MGGVERIEVARENRRRRKISAAAGLTNKAKKWSMARGQVYVCVCVSSPSFFFYLTHTHTHVGRVSFFLTDCLVCLLTSSAMHSPPAQKQTFAKDIPSHLSVVLDSFFLITVIASCCCRSRLFGVRLCPTATKLRELSVRPCPRESRSPPKWMSSKGL